MDYEEKYLFAKEKFASFDNYLEVSDFRRFLLLILNLDSVGPEAMLRQLGMGAKGKIILPYEPEKKLYYTKIMAGFSNGPQLSIYQRSEETLSKFINKPDSDFITKFLSEYERKNLLPSNFMIVSPKIVDFTKKELNGVNSPKKIIPGIESLYLDLGEFIASQKIKFIFLLEDEKADIAFSLNMSFEPNSKSENSIQYFDIYIDEEKKLRNYTYIKVKTDDLKDEEIKIEFLNVLKDFSHSELFDSLFTIIVPIKSMEVF